MSGFTSFGGSAAATNPNYLPELIGVDASGVGTTVTAHASTNTKGTYSQLSASTASAWTRFKLRILSVSAASNRYILYLSKDGGTSDFLSIFVLPGQVTTTLEITIPMIVGAASDFQIACQSNTGGATVAVAVEGLSPVSAAAAPPGYSTATAITSLNTTTTHASTTSVTVGTDHTSYTTLIADTAAEYGAFLFFYSASTNPTNAQSVTFRFAKGDAASEVVIGTLQYPIITTASGDGRGMVIVEATVAAGERISCSIDGATGGDAILVGAIGLAA